MGSVLAGALMIAISILLVTHFYFSFTSHTSIESGMLMDFNPYFESNLSEEENRNYATEQEGRSCLNRLLYFSRKNFYQMCGTKVFYWLLPLRTPK